MQYVFAERRNRRRFTLFVAAAGLSGVIIGAQAAGAAGPPAVAPPATAPVGNWSAWTPTAGPSFLSPSLALNPVTGALQVAAVGLDLNVVCTQVSTSSAAPLPVGRQSFLPTVLLSDAAGLTHLMVTGTDAAITHSRFQNNAWGAPLSTGLLSFLPPAAVVESDGSTIDLVAVGPQSDLEQARFVGGAWSSPAPLSVITALPPALAANPAGGVELAMVGLDRQVYHTHFDGRQWSTFEPTGVLTNGVPALAIGPDGVVHLAATGLDRNVVHSRFVNHAWTAPAPTGAQSDLSPALVFNSGASAVELLVRGNDRTVKHARFINSAWLAPVSLGITTDVRPALSTDGKGGLVAAVTATDGRIYVSRFTGSVAPAGGGTPGNNAASPPSFARDILRIFTNNAAKTCAQAFCHSGSHPAGDQNLEKDKAYTNIVNVASSEVPKLKRVLPGDAANSYLFQKVVTGAMPRTGGPLTAGDVDLIRQWINAGAPNN
jgi:hypothetical protein